MISFAMLRNANVARLPLFRNKHGELAHSMSDGSDWSPAQWLQAVIGELGEYANVRKKYERGDIDAAEFHALASKELADVQTYLDILAYQLRIDLGAATAAKFNEVSDRVGCDVKIIETDHPEEMVVYYKTHEEEGWKKWPQSAVPHPPRPEDAPFYEAGPGIVRWPLTGVHFHAIRFGEREWDAIDGWRKR